MGRTGLMVLICALLMSAYARLAGTWHHNAGAVSLSRSLLTLDGPLPDGISESFRLAVVSCPGLVQSWVALARVARKSGRRSEAEDLLIKARQINPEHLVANREWASLLEEKGRHEEAVAVWRRLGSSRDLIRLANSMLARKDLGRAERFYREAISVESKSRVAHSSLADVLRTTGRLEGAVGELERAIECDPLYVWSYVELARIRRRQGRPADALKWYRKALDVDPRNIAAATEAAVTRYWTIGQREEALTELTAIVSSAPKVLLPYLALGDISQHRGDYSRAEWCYLQAVQVETENAYAWASLGKIAFGQGDFRKAAESFRAAVKADARNDRYYWWLARSCWGRGDRAGALGAIHQAIALTGDGNLEYRRLANAWSTGP